MTIPEMLRPAEASAFTRDLLAKIGENSPDLIYAKDTRSRMLFANRAVLGVLGKSWEEIRGRSDDEWHDDPNEGRRFVEADARIMAADATETLEEVLTGVDGTHIYLSTKSPLHAEDGTVIGLFGISKNITERKKAEKLRQILLNELEHRVKNTLALVHAITRQTFKPVSIDDALWQAFEGRLTSMSQAHTVLTRESWVGADIADIVAQGLIAHGGGNEGRFTIGGPSAWVDAQTALALALAFHELGTNAVKYGALSAPQGRVTIAWHVESDGNVPMLNLSWIESGGPTVVEPTRKGFGSRLIQQAFGNAASNGPRINYLPEGVEFHVRVKVAERLGD